jgi:beta-lactamase superfamily II metal-dependent hydrolase
MRVRIDNSSAVVDNPFGHPSPEVLDRLNTTHLYRTDVYGTVELITDGNRLWAKTER